MTFKTNERPDPESPPNSTDRTDSTAGTMNMATGIPPASSAEARLAGLPVQKRPVPLALLVVAALLMAVASYFMGRGSTVAASPGSAPGPTSAATSEKSEKGEPGADASGEAKASGGAGESGKDGKPGAITIESEVAKSAGVKVVPVRSAPFGETLTVPGSVEVSPNRAARVTPPVGGTVVSLLAAPGDAVRAGQRLAVLDSPEVAQAHAAVREAASRVAEAKAQVQTAQAGIEQALTKRGSAEAALQRQRELAQTGALSQPSLQAAQNELNTSQSELTQAQTELQAQTVIVARNRRLFDAQVVAKAELEQSQVAEAQARTRVEQAQKRAALARQTLGREQRVFKGGLLNRQAVQAAEAEVRAAEGDVRQARRQEQAARTSLAGARSGLAGTEANLRALEGKGHTEGGAGRISLYAPIGGTVAARGATLGQAVERSSELFTIQSLQAVVVEAYVPETSAGRVRVGATVTVTVAAYPNARFLGVVQSIGSGVDPKTRALPVRCLVQNRGSALRPEMFAKVSLETGGTVRAVTVPRNAVDEDGDKRFVYVRTGADSYEKRAVTVGRTSGTSLEILDGVKPDENVVSGGVFVLKSESKKDELKGDED